MSGPGDFNRMKVQLMHVESAVGRVLVGPKKVRSTYFRIVSLRDGSGCIERFDFASRAWIEAPDGVTFSEIWSAPSVPMIQLAGIIDGKP